MDIIIQKFGGSSLKDNNSILNVCNFIIEEYNSGNKVVVVVSAQGNVTDELILEEKEICVNVFKREHDMLVSVGEQISCAKLVMYLNKLGYKAISYTGWQVPILTDNNFGDANIINIKTDKIFEKLQNDYILVIAGFQGVNEIGDITTLGRGGSDTTAVALAHYLKAKKCVLFKDVDGVYNKDPNIDINAFKYKEISYDDMLKLSLEGACVLHNKCILMANKYNVPIIIKSIYTGVIGTVIK